MRGRALLALGGIALIGAAVACQGRPSKPPAGGNNAAAMAAAPRARTVGAKAGADCAKQLQGIADCFFRAVTVLQREPKPGAEGRFLAAAKASGKATARCGAVRVDAQGRVTLRGGAAVKIARKPASTDHFQGGGVRRFTPYLVTAPGCAGAGKTTIEHVIGKP